MVWYLHRYTPDLLARMRTDYVHERRERYRSHIAELMIQIDLDDGFKVNYAKFSDVMANVR